MLHGPNNVDPSDLYLRWFGHLTVSMLWKSNDLRALLVECGFTVHNWQRLERDSTGCAVGIVEDPDGKWRVVANDPMAWSVDDHDFFWHQPISRTLLLHRLLDRNPGRTHTTLGDLVQDLAEEEVFEPFDDGWVTGVALRSALGLLPVEDRDAHRTLIALGKPEILHGLDGLDRWYAEHPELSSPDDEDGWGQRRDSRFHWS